MITDYYRHGWCYFKIRAEQDDSFFDNEYIWKEYKTFHKRTIIKLLSMTWKHYYDRNSFIKYLKQTKRFSLEIELAMKLL